MKLKRLLNKTALWICLCFILLMPASIATETVYVVRADNNYPPYEFLEDGVPTGFNIDMIRAVAEVMNLKIDVRMGPWNEVRTDLEEGRIDALAGMYYSEERDKKVDFSIPHVIVSQSLFVRNNSPYNSLEGLKDKEIIVQKGDVMNDFLIENKNTTKIILVENQQQAINLLSSGKHDAALISKLQGFYFMKLDKIDNIKAIGTAIQPQDYCFAVREGDTKLQAQLNEGLNILKTNGTYKEIYNKWFGVFEEQAVATEVYRTVRLILIPVIAFITLFFVWNWSLRTQVRRKTLALKESYEHVKQLNETLEQRVQERTLELQSVNQELRDFAYIVSHDLKAPLRGISQVSKWLSEDQSIIFTSENRELMDLLINRVHRMDNLISGILAYSKASRTTSFDNQFDLDVMVKRIVNAMAIPLNVNIELQPNLPVIVGSEMRIEEVFQNLISNALQHVNPENGIIQVGWSEDDIYWKFWVKDNGTGIEEKYFDKIFGMFQTLESRDNKESTGIGLTIVKKIVELHGGHIWIESKLHEGATFYFTLLKRGQNYENE